MTFLSLGSLLTIVPTIRSSSLRPCYKTIFPCHGANPGMFLQSNVKYRLIPFCERSIRFLPWQSGSDLSQQKLERDFQRNLHLRHLNKNNLNTGEEMSFYTVSCCLQTPFLLFAMHIPKNQLLVESTNHVLLEPSNVFVRRICHSKAC